MLTWPEKLLFLVALALSIYFSYLGFRKVYLVIRRGQGEPFDTKGVIGKAFSALLEWITMRPIWRARTGTSIFHAMIAWGFIFYFLVNFADVLQGLFGFTFLGTGFAGNVYRLLADVFTMSVLIGMIYFLVRRFILRSKALTYNDNVLLMDKVKKGGIARDSLIVGIFILCHVGFRMLGESFLIAEHGGDPWQPFGNALSQPLVRHERNATDGRRTYRLVGCHRPDSGLHPLLSLHQTLSSRHVRLQLPDETQTHGDGFAGSHRLRG